ncbi:MAG: tRNA (adenosine(37)-N6)-dimethylallyltransferase MiaA [Oscillospiraceae bacterium]
MEERKKIVVICGPTASGKTKLSLLLAKKFNGEIISADSMQVYKGLDIGTAKVSLEEQQEAKHHLVDFLPPSQKYNVEIFTRLAAEKIMEISSEEKLPIIAGGTGLYIESLVNGITFTDQNDTSEIRKELAEALKEKGGQYMYNLLESIDGDYAKNVHPNNTVRVLRALELYKATGKTMTQQLENSHPIKKPYDELLIGISYISRENLYDNINKRVDSMISQGLLKEARYVYDNRNEFKNSAAAIGYKEFFPFFEQLQSLEACTEKLKQSSRNYAKRQLTWFNRMKNINWVYVDGTENYIEKALQLTENFVGGNN